MLDRLKHTVPADPSADEKPLAPQNPAARMVTRPSKILHYGVFDLETQRSAAEVGGWHRAHLMKISCAVLYDSKQDRFIDFMENQVSQFIERLQTYDLIIGFNIKRFDYQVLRGYSDFNFQNLKSLDILQDVKKYLNFRLSLAHLASVTLGESKSADGLQALRWWQEGRILEIIKYCRQDVKITRDLYCYGRDKGYLVLRTGKIRKCGYRLIGVKKEYRISNKKYRIMKFFYPSTFIIPCSIFDIRFFINSARQGLFFD